MKVEWSPLAVTDRTAIFDHIEADSPKAAIAVDDRIGAGVRRLARFPLSGRPGRVHETRELVVSGTPYVVAYRVTGDTVRILRLLHGSQRWPDEMPDNHESSDS